MATVKEQVQQIYVGLLGRAADKEGLDYWVDEIESGALTLEELRSNAVNEQPEGQDIYDSSNTRTEIVTALYENLFERTPDEDGLEYWVTGEGKSVNVDQLVNALIAGAGTNDAQVLANKVEAAQYYTDNAGASGAAFRDDARAAVADVDGTAESVEASKAATDELDQGGPVDPGVEGETFKLTAGTDDMTGTADNDLFSAKLSQNEFTGGVSNTLSSADEIDGGAGTDTLAAVVTGEFVGVDGTNEIDIQPTTSSVENVTFEARDTGAGSDGAVNVDAKRMADVVEIGSSFSDGDLVIENLTTLTSAGEIRNTRDMTITMNHTEGQNSSGNGSDLAVYFDEDYLNNTTSFGGSTLEVRVVNAITNVLGDNPIFGTAAFSFEVGGNVYTVDVEDIGNDETLDGPSAYAAVVDRINETMADEGLTTVSAELLPLRNAVFSIDITTDDGDYEAGDPAGQFNPILITNTGPEVLGQGQFTQSDVADDTNIAATQLEGDGETAVQPITTNIELEKVGRDGEGGSLIVGGKDQNSDNDQEEDQNDGFEVFNITVNGDEDKPSNLRFITSTDQSLKTVNIADGDQFDGASLEVRDAFNGVDANLTNATNVDTVNANDFSGDLTLGNGGGAAEDRMQNVDQFTATGGGNVEVWADISGAERSAFSMNTGAGSDTLNVTLNGDAVDTVGTGFSASTGGGNDTVIVSMVEGGVSHNTTESLDNLSIDTGSGDDSITLIGGTTAGTVANAGNADGDANFNITAGGGSDTVYINSIDDGGALASEVQTITITADGADEDDETITVNFDSDGDGTLDATTVVNLDATVDATDAGAIASAVAAGLNGDGTFAGVASASATGNVVSVTYNNAQDQAELTATAGGTTTGLAAAVATTTVGGTAGTTATKGEWSIGTATEPQTWNDRVLYNATLTVNYAGFEQQVTIDTDSDGNFIATQATINAAVIDAISSNSELSRLLETTLGTGNERLLTIEALHEGANDLTISVNQPTVTTTSVAGNESDLLAGIVETTANNSSADVVTVLNGIAGNLNETGAVGGAGDLVLDSADNTDGTNETSVTNYSVIDMGTGSNDLVVLNSDVDSVNTLDFTAAWGKVSVVNWFEEQANTGNGDLTDATTGNHILDFTFWLDDQTSATGSELSAVRTATTSTVLNAGAADLNLESNEVVVFNGFSQTSATAETWAGMDAAAVDASLEGTEQYGSAGFGNTAVANSANAYPATNLLDSILMVENDNNAGEYKVFNVETDSTAAAGSQYTVTLVGVIDFGETLDTGFADANVA